jgi:CCR4-NOT transcription complex subunit 7/8
VDLLKLIQLGITFTDSKGGLKPGVCTWQFNLKFDLEQDMFAQDSIDLLQRSGIEFDKHR